MIPSALVMIAFRGSQDGQKRQSPHPAHPRNRHQHHHTQPAQPARFDKMALTRSDGIAINPFRGDLLTASPFQRIVEPQDNRTLGNEDVDQDQQQWLTDSPTRPAGAIEHAMIVLKVPTLTQAHHRQNGRDSAAAGSQDRAHDQNLSVIPDRGRKQRRKQRQEGSHFGGQVQHPYPRVAKCSTPYPAVGGLTNG